MNTNYLIPVNFMEVCYMSSGTWFKTKKKATPLVPPVSKMIKKLYVQRMILNRSNLIKCFI